MLQKLSIIILLFYSISFIGCSDVYEELSGDYFYRDEGSYVKQILSHSQKNRKNDIYSKIIKFNYDDNFIIASQEPIYEDYVSKLAFNLRTEQQKLYPENSVNDRMKSEIIADSILHKSDFYKKIFVSKLNYWIIDNKRDSLIGPMSFNEYLNKRHDLGVPKNLELE